MPSADDLARLRLGTRVRLYHLIDGERRATSGTLVSVRDGIVRVRPLSGADEQMVELANIHDMTVAEPPKRSLPPPFSFLRVVVGAALFGALGLFVAMLVVLGGGAEVAYVVWAAFILFGAVAGVFASGVGHPWHYLSRLRPLRPVADLIRILRDPRP